MKTEGVNVFWFDLQVSLHPRHVSISKQRLLLHCGALVFIELQVSLLQRLLSLARHHTDLYETSPGAFTFSRKQYLGYPLDQALSG